MKIEKKKKKKNANSLFQPRFRCRRRPRILRSLLDEVDDGNYGGGGKDVPQVNYFIHCHERWLIIDSNGFYMRP